MKKQIESLKYGSMSKKGIDDFLLYLILKGDKELLISTLTAIPSSVEDATYALTCAANRNNLEIVEAIIKAVLDKIRDATEALKWATHRNNLQMVKYILQNASDKIKDTSVALWLAAENEKIDIVKIILAKPNKVQDANYALNCATYYNNLEMVKAIIKVLPNKISDLTYALDCATYHNNLEMIEVINKALANKEELAKLELRLNIEKHLYHKNIIKAGLSLLTVLILITAKSIISSCKIFNSNVSNIDLAANAVIGISAMVFLGAASIAIKRKSDIRRDTKHIAQVKSSGFAHIQI